MRPDCKGVGGGLRLALFFLFAVNHIGQYYSVILASFLSADSPLYNVGPQFLERKTRLRHYQKPPGPIVKNLLLKTCCQKPFVFALYGPKSLLFRFLARVFSTPKVTKSDKLFDSSPDMN